MDSSAEAPLISNRDDSQIGDDIHDDDTLLSPAEQGHVRGGERRGQRIGLFMWLLTFSAGISGLLFGYDTGVISATLVSIGTSLSGRELTSLDKSIITSATSLAALLASPASSILADARGRRPVILVADTLFVAGALVQAASGTVASMVAGRAVVGAAVGAASFVTPMYIAELAPARYRGRLVTLNCAAVTLGQVVAYVVGWAFAEHDGGSSSEGWRWMVGLGALPAALQAVLLLAMPETPRWLVKAGRPPAAAWKVIARTMGASSLASPSSSSPSSQVDAAEVDAVLKSIQMEVREEEQSRLMMLPAGSKGKESWLDGWRELVAVPKHRRALIIACLLQGLQQLCGFNSLMYFSATIFTLLGFRIPTLTSLSVAMTNFIFTLVALVLIDRVGRRRILLWSIPFMAVGLWMSGYSFKYVHLPSTSSSSPPPAAETTPASSQASAATVILVSMIFYVASYAIGLGSVPWMQSELFPLSVRSLGSGVATATNWLANFAVGLTFLPMMDTLTPTWTFVLYGVVCAFGWVAIWLIYPETSGLTLEEVTGLFETGWGV
ncbi:general substrate transporter [Xylariales sp. PMI_506]|nr:general substrate transporter [Xylariales sp. PMI_506]